MRFQGRPQFSHAICVPFFFIVISRYWIVLQSARPRSSSTNIVLSSLILLVSQTSTDYDPASEPHDKRLGLLECVWQLFLMSFFQLCSDAAQRDSTRNPFSVAYGMLVFLVIRVFALAGRQETVEKSFRSQFCVFIIKQHV